MPKITEKQTLTMTRDEAVSYIKRAHCPVRFQVQLSAFLPTKEDRGFEGIKFMSISRKQAKEAVLGLLSPTFEERGGRIRLHVTPADPQFTHSSAYISIY